MGDLVFEPARREDLGKVAHLMAVGFPKARKFSPAFLEWQYYANPVGPPHGCNVFEDGRLVGHLAAIPQPFRLHGAPVTLSLLMNVATHPDCRGRGLFLELVRRTCDQARELGHAAVIGVANQQTIRAYETRLGFQNVAGLDARIELVQGRVSMAEGMRTADLAHDWTPQALRWRLANPANPLKITAVRDDGLLVEGASGLPLLGARGAIPALDGVSPSSRRLPRPAVVVGLTPVGIGRPALAVDIPQALRPSPLRLIYRHCTDSGDRLDPERILFSFLDFDAF